MIALYKPSTFNFYMKEMVVLKECWKYAEQKTIF